MMVPLPIPATSPEVYISFKSALNARLPEEDTGDWHEPAFWYDTGKQMNPLENDLAGFGRKVNSRFALGDKGVRDLSEELRKSHGVNGPVYVANHYRAVADLALKYLQDGKAPVTLDNGTINAWFDTEAQIEHLCSDYLLPLRKQLDDAGKKVFDTWIATVQFD